MEIWQALKKEELALKMKNKGLELETEIAKAAAEELAYAQAEKVATHAIFSNLSSHAPLSQGGSGVRRRPQSPTNSSFATKHGREP